MKTHFFSRLNFCVFHPTQLLVDEVIIPFVLRLMNGNREEKRERMRERKRVREGQNKYVLFVIKTCRNRIFKMQAPHSKINRQPLRMVRLPLPDARFKSHTSPLYHFFTFLYHSLTKQTCKNQWCYPNHYEPKRTPIRCRKEMKKAEKSGKRYHL